MHHDSGRPFPMPRALLWSLVCCTAACTGGGKTSRTAALEEDTGPIPQWSNLENVGYPECDGKLNTPFNDSYAVLTKSGLEVYFASDRPGTCSETPAPCRGDAFCPAGEVCSVKGGYDLWMATRDSVDSGWNDPVNLAALNGPGEDSLPMLSHSENVMWFYSDRPEGSCGAGDIWKSRRDPRTGAWGAPVNLDFPVCSVNTAATENAPAFYANDELGVTTLYFGSNRSGGIGDFDVYETSTTDEDLYRATWSPPVLVPNINSTGRDTRTWIRRDGRELFITSDRVEPGSVGGLDIWYSTREASTDEWRKPVDLGAQINSAAADGSPSLTWDGDTLYFFSSRSGGCGGRDIWLGHRQRSP